MALSLNDASALNAMYFADKEAWDALANEFAEKYGMGISRSSLPEIFQPIDVYFFATRKFVRKDEFKWQHVEPLLEQTATLLDRAISGKEKWDDLRVQAFELSAELSQYYKNHEVHESEIKSGAYELDYIQAQARLAATDEGLVSQRAAAASVLEKQALFTAESREEVMRLRIRQAYNGAMPLYLETPALNKFGEPAQTKPMWAKLDEEQASARSLNIESHNVNAEAHRSKAEVSVNESLRDAYASVARWECANREFRMQRTMIAKEVMDHKLQQSTIEGGVLNYLDRMANIKARFESDFEQAIERIIALKEGLAIIYGYDTSSWDLSRARTAEQIVVWVRAAINWLVRFSRNDQDSLSAFSMRYKVGEDIWSRFLSTGSVSMSVSDRDFQGQYHVRLRGVRVLVASNAAPRGHWRAMVYPPTASQYFHLDGRALNINQEGLSPCVVGRIGRYEDLEPAGLNGSSTLHNGSPIGEWTISLSETSSVGDKRGTLEDVYLEMLTSSRVAQNRL